MTDRVGQQLGNYRLIRLLGKGGFAEVYLGEHVYLETQAAIKLLLTQLASEDIEPFRLEAKRLAHLEHSHIVRVLEFGVDGLTPFLVMSYAPNGTLRQHHPKGVVLPLPTILGYIKQAADALQYAHDEHFIHRDVKPENLLVGRRQEVLLSDFGIAIVTHSTYSQQTEDVIGTALYMAPEQWQGKPLPATDQYALGIIVYEWLCGECPFTGGTLQLMYQHIHIPPPPLHQKNPMISPEVEQVVLKTLAKDPKARFTSVQAFAQALAAAIEQDKPLAPAVPTVLKKKLPQSAPAVSQKTKEDWLNEGLAHYNAGQYEKAIADYDRTLAIDFNYAIAYYNRGNAYYALQQYDKAIEDYDQTLKFAPKHLNAQMFRREAYRLIQTRIITPQSRQPLDISRLDQAYDIVASMESFPKPMKAQMRNFVKEAETATSTQEIEAILQDQIAMVEHRWQNRGVREYMPMNVVNIMSEVLLVASNHNIDLIPDMFATWVDIVGKRVYGHDRDVNNKAIQKFFKTLPKIATNAIASNNPNTLSSIMQAMQKVMNHYDWWSKEFLQQRESLASQTMVDILKPLRNTPQEIQFDWLAILQQCIKIKKFDMLSNSTKLPGEVIFLLTTLNNIASVTPARAGEVKNRLKSIIQDADTWQTSALERPAIAEAQKILAAIP